MFASIYNIKVEINHDLFLSETVMKICTFFEKCPYKGKKYCFVEQAEKKLGRDFFHGSVVLRKQTIF